MTPRLRAGAWILAILTTAFILRSAVGHPLWIHTRGMVPTLYADEVAWVSNRTPILGDVVKVHFGDDPGVYRLVALEGQRVEIDNGVLIVDGQVVQSDGRTVVDAQGVDCSVQRVPAVDSMINGRSFKVVPGGRQTPIRVPRGAVYLLGDHRGVAGDSRPWGAVKNTQVNGVLTHVLWSWDPCEKTPRWQRIGNSIQ